MHAPRWILTVAAIAAAVGATHAAALPADVRQLIVGVAPSWDATAGTVQCFERTDSGWQPSSAVMPALFGRTGLAWGRGVCGAEEIGLRKVEGDGRTPAGVFALGKVFGYDTQLPEGADFPFHQVTAADAWIDDPTHPQYNRHVIVDPRNPPAWFEQQRMRLGDAAFHWMIEVRHNADPPEPGAGSAIFLHIRRGPTRPTVGCTALAEEDLLKIIRWLRADRHPHFALLPAAEYARRWQTWDLPPPVSDH